MAGIASLLRSGKRLSWRAIATSLVYNGTVGLAIAFCWFRWFDGNKADTFFMMGLATLTVLSGTASLELILNLLRKGGITINVFPKQED